MCGSRTRTAWYHNIPRNVNIFYHLQFYSWYLKASYYSAPLLTHRKYYARASFSLSLHYRSTSTLLCMLLLDTTMKCKVVSNGLITSKVWVGFGRNLQIFKNIFFLHLWSIGYKFHTSIQRGYTIFVSYGIFKWIWLVGGGVTISSTRGALYEAEKNLMS